jgi:hypothetical protein
MWKEDKTMFVRNFDLTLDPKAAMQIALLVRKFDTEDFVLSDEDDAGDEAVADEEDLLESATGYSDSVLEELLSAIDMLDVDSQRDLLALIWVGRGDFGPEDWSVVRRQAAETADNHLAEYLAGTPLASDYLVEGLNQMGYAVSEQIAL